MRRASDPRRGGASTTVDLAERSFHHEALFYTEGGFLEGTLPFINEAVTAGEPILVAVSNDRLELLKEALGHDAEGVHFADMGLVGRNPARIIPAWRQFLETNAPEGQVRGIGEPIWPGRSRAEVTECQREESLLNLAFDEGRAWRLLCTYDLDGLDEQVIEAAQRSHPLIAQNGASRRSNAYAAADGTPGSSDGPLPRPPTHVEELEFTRDELTIVRGLRGQLRRAGAPLRRTPRAPGAGGERAGNQQRAPRWRPGNTSCMERGRDFAVRGARQRAHRGAADGADPSNARSAVRLRPVAR
jgi:hypothetical protein